jgi:glutamyl-tRNA synthetase
MAEILDFLKAYNGEWHAVPLKEQFSAFVNKKEWDFGVVMNAFRLCIVGAAMGADLFEICEMIGRDETISRIQKALNTLEVK